MEIKIKDAIDQLTNHLTCSYKPVLLYILILDYIYGKSLDFNKIVERFINFYKIRKLLDLPEEKPPCNPFQVRIKEKVREYPLRILKNYKFIDDFSIKLSQGLKNYLIKRGNRDILINLIKKKIIEYFKNKVGDTDDQIKNFIHVSKIIMWGADINEFDSISSVHSRSDILLNKLIQYQILPTFMTFLFDKWCGISTNKGISSTSRTRLDDFYQEFGLPKIELNGNNKYYNPFSGSFVTSQTFFFEHVPRRFGCYYGDEKRKECKNVDCSQLKPGKKYKCNKKKPNLWVQDDINKPIRLVNEYVGVVENEILRNKKIEIEILASFFYPTTKGTRIIERFIKDFNINEIELGKFFLKKPQTEREVVPALLKNYKKEILVFLYGESIYDDNENLYIYYNDTPNAKLVKKGLISLLYYSKSYPIKKKRNTFFGIAKIKDIQYFDDKKSFIDYFTHRVSFSSNKGVIEEKLKKKIESGLYRLDGNTIIIPGKKAILDVIYFSNPIKISDLCDKYPKIEDVFRSKKDRKIYVSLSGISRLKHNENISQVDILNLILYEAGFESSIFSKNNSIEKSSDGNPKIEGNEGREKESSTQIINNGSHFNYKYNVEIAYSGDAMQIKKALVEFGPCSVRDLFDYLQSSLALKRGLYIPGTLTMDKLRRELEKLVDTDESIVKFNCTSGTKIRYGLTNFVDYPISETRYLHPSGTIHACMYCGLQVFTKGCQTFHFPGLCSQCINQTFFKIIRFAESKAIVSNSFVFGVIDKENKYHLRLPKQLHVEGYKSLLSELWYINELAREKGIIHKEKILPLNVMEKFRKPKCK
ncbi:MAG: hypothetical protein ACTSUE_22235 [Promethearchaeota archaeon]